MANHPTITELRKCAHDLTWELQQLTPGSIPGSVSLVQYRKLEKQLAYQMVMRDIKILELELRIKQLGEMIGEETDRGG